MSRRRDRYAALALTLVAAASVVPRLPFLASAEALWTADEAVDALVVRHLLHGELALFPWDATYYGLAEGLLGLPLNFLFGWSPLVFKLAAFSGFLLLLSAVYLLGRRLHGRAAGLWAAALLAGFSPALVGWSTLAAGGYCLVVAWGTLTLLYLTRVERKPTPARAFLLGAMAGFGLYIYELYLVYVAFLALWALPRSFAWRALRAKGAAARRAALALAPDQLRAAALFAAGLVLGWAPKLALLAARAAGGGGSLGAKQPAYALAGPARMAGNLRLLGLSTQALFGVNLGLNGDLERLVAPYGRRPAMAGALLLLAWGAIWLWSLWRQRRTLIIVEPEPPGVAALLPLLLPLAALAFVASRNPQDPGSNRYLLPWLSALPVLGGAALADLAREGRRRGARAAALALAVLLLMGFPLVQIGRWYVEHQLLAADRHGLHLLRQREPLADVLAYLERAGIAAAYSPYWTAYKATLLSGERVIVAPMMDWDRYPPYRRAVDRAPRVAYLFPADETAFSPNEWQEATRIRAAFESRVASSGERADIVLVGTYAILRGPGDRHLLPPPWAAPAPLPSFRAAIDFAAPPSAPLLVAPGGRLALAVRLVNASGGAWSADGLPRQAGALRVAAAVRWQDAEGRPLPGEPERSLLPRDVAPGDGVTLLVHTTAPAQPGRYRLYVTLVQDGLAWFDQETGSESPPLPVVVGSAP